MTPDPLTLIASSTGSSSRIVAKFWICFAKLWDPVQTDEKDFESTGLDLSKNDYYNLIRSSGQHTPQEKLFFSLGTLEREEFHVRIRKVYEVVDNVRRQETIESFFFCNDEQTQIVRRFISSFPIKEVQPSTVL